jgi:hypothetical protein
VTVEELNKRLQQGEIVTLGAEDWSSLEKEFEELERHATFVVGDLLIVRGKTGLAAVEEPFRDKRVVRPLSSEEAKNDFVKKRLEKYERMWDGCGCKIDYYK